MTNLLSKQEKNIDVIHKNSDFDTAVNFDFNFDFHWFDLILIR